MARKSRKNRNVESNIQTVVKKENLLDTAAYIRLSVENGGNETDETLVVQQMLVERFIEEHPDLRLEEVYIDNGFTGTNFERPGFMRLMEDVRSGKVQCIVVKDLSRFGRDYAYVFPEFALGKYIADYLLIGKSSGGYEFVFVELEHPNGRTTLKSGHEGETFRKGTYQIYDWKAEIEAHFSASFVTITKYSNKSSLPKEFSEYDSSRFHYAVVAGLREDYNEATYRDRRNKVTQQNILTLHYDNLYDKACELETAQSF